MRLCRKILAISFKEKSIFRFDYIVGTVFAFLYIVLKVYLWKGLYGTGGKAIGGITLNSMIVYSIIAGDKYQILSLPRRKYSAFLRTLMTSILKTFSGSSCLHH